MRQHRRVILAIPEMVIAMLNLQGRNISKGSMLMRLRLALPAMVVAVVFVALFALRLQAADEVLVTLSPPSKTEYLLGETMSFGGSVEFLGVVDGTVTLEIDGPQPVTQVLPTIPGVYLYPDNNLTVTVTLEWESEAYAYAYEGGVTTVNYDMEWITPALLSPPPVFKIIPDHDVAFIVPVPSPTPTPTPGGPAQ